MTTAPAARTPTLTALDERVLGELAPDRRGVRASAIARELNRRRPAWSPYTAQDEVRGVLRGLEHLGLARQRGGWWRRADPEGTT